MAEGTTDTGTPNWVVELENRLQSRKQKLGHEIGAGAKCLLCIEKCPGLELHFWRKICKNCKCSKEDHDVIDDDNLRFDILFTGRENSAKYQAVKKVLEVKVRGKLLEKTVLRLFSNTEDVVKPMKFDWVPAAASPCLAADYMNELPSNRIPVSGSDGAKYRKVQLQKQIPMHDMLPQEREKFTPQEEAEFMKYLGNLRDNAGIGKILRVKQFREEIHSQPITTLTPQSSQPIKPDMTSDVQQLSTGVKNINIHPPMFISSPAESPIGFRPPPGLRPPRAFRPLTTTFPQMGFVDASPRSALRSLPNTIPCSVLRLPSEFRQKVCHFENQFVEPNFNDTTFDNANESLNTTTTTGLFGDNESTDNSLDITGVSPLPKSPLDDIEPNNNTENENGPSLNNFAGSSTPIYPGVLTPVPATPSKTAEKMTSPYVGGNKNDVALRSTIDSEESVNSDMTNANHDKDPSFVPPESSAEVQLFKTNLKCVDCAGEIEFNSIAIFIEKQAPHAAWHPKCFVCKECRELLVDLVYFFHEGSVYCGRHYTEKLKIERCSSCDELIFNKEYTNAEGLYYHLNHFCCIDCDTELGGKQYLLNDLNNNHPTCLECFEAVYAKVCSTCHKPIKAEQQGVTYKHLSWHATPECFKCAYNGCNKVLLNQLFIVLNSLPFCSKQCIHSHNNGA